MKVLAAALAASLAMAVSSAAHADCKLYGGIGNGLTEDLAKFMADAAVKNIIDSECTARQQGCR
ncbi:MAG: hypothetical protein MUC33_23515 [Desulfobacterales bacterium]|nr:hypothetical protein [Desulfobacterales bacterium]